MNLVFFSHYFTPEGNAPASRTYENCKHWVAQGHQVTVITCAPNVPAGIVYEGYRNRFWPQRSTVDGIHVIRVWTFMAANAGNTKRILNYLSYLFSAVFAFLFFCGRPDVVIATSPQFFCGWAGVLASWLKWTPFVLEVRDLWPESIVAVGAMRRGVVTRFLELLERWMYHSADVIVTVTQGLKQKILERVKLDTPIVLITNGVDLNRFQALERTNEFLKKHQLENRFVCSYVGTIGMAHGLDIVIEAAEALKSANKTDVVFLLVGDGADRARLENEVKTRQLGELVRFTGRLDKSEIPMVLASSDAHLVHLRKSELFEGALPSKIFETMAMQCPIVLGVAGEAAELIRRAEAGIVIESSNEVQLIDAITHLAQHPDLRKKLGANGKSYVSQHYSRTVLAQNFLELLETSFGQVRSSSQPLKN